MNRWDILEFMKKNRRFMTEKEISTKCKSTQPSTHTKLKSWVKFKKLEVKQKKIKLGKGRYKFSRKVKHFRYKATPRKGK